MNKLITYPNGLRLIVNKMASVRTVASSIWVGAGSAIENNVNNGISHFTEHMLFKGTPSMTPFQIADNFEKIGACVNAFTGKESTCYYVKSIDENADECLGLLADIFFNSKFDKVELDKERKVIVEEINMVEDSPEDICFDLMNKAMYGTHPLAQTILGGIDNVTKFDKPHILEFMEEFYCAKNIVVSMAGNITIEQADAMVRKYFMHNLSTCHNNAIKKDIHYDIKSTAKYRIKDFEQSNIAISYPSIPMGHKYVSTQAIFNVIFGGGMSSRLFQSVREQLGLAYSIYTAPTAFADNGSFNIICNITHTNTEKTITEVKKQVEKIIAEGFHESEFMRAKAQMKSALVFSNESVQTNMISAGKILLSCDEIYSTNKKIRDMDKVTLEDVNKFSHKILTNKNVCTAYVGKECNTDIMSIING